MKGWQTSGKGWCEWALESAAPDLKQEQQLFRQEKRKFRAMRKSRREAEGLLLRWQLLLPNDIYFPFIMSAYVPQPVRPQVVHPNDIRQIATVLIGEERLDRMLLDKLLPQQGKIEYVKGKTGLVTVRFAGSQLLVEDILG